MNASQEPAGRTCFYQGTLRRREALELEFESTAKLHLSPSLGHVAGPGGGEAEVQIF